MEIFSSLSLNFAKELNPQQLKVVEQAEGPCLVLAGAGSGKTKVLVWRLAYLLQKGISPHEVMLVTFSNKASRHMIQRAEALLNIGLQGLWAGTFHHIANLIIRKEAEQIGFRKDFTIIDREDAKDLLQDVFESLGISKKDKTFPKKDIILNLWSFARNSRRDLGDVLSREYEYLSEYQAEIKKALALFQKRKQSANLMDFDDLLSFWLKLLKNDVLKDKYSRLFRYILVDEYQDTNRIQFEILKKISSFWRNILVVGDDAQSIYSFRAAEIKNILEFPKIFANSQVFKLETNYRSSPQILALANASIKNNQNQFAKTLKSVKPEGALPQVIACADVYQQAKFVCEKIKQLYRQGEDLAQIAVLFRSRYNALELEVELLRENLPYIVRGGLRFFEQAHIKDILAFLKVLANPKDELSFKRALCLEEGIGRIGAQKAWQAINREKDFKRAELALSKRQKEGFRRFAQIIAELKSSPSPAAAIKALIAKYHDYCYLNFDNAEERMLDLEELANLASGYEDINEFLMDLSSYEDFKGERAPNQKENQKSLVLSTIHQAKGLEWKIVFLISLNEGDFPHPKSFAENRLEEERRLFYVAVTRTKQLLYLVCFQRRYSFQEGPVISRPSLFLQELPQDLVEITNLNE